MTQSYPVRQNIFFVRADKPNLTVPSSFVGGTPTTFVVGTPQVLPTAVEIPGDRAINCGGHLTGTTAQRPNALTDADFQSLAGTLFFDQTLQVVVVHDGQNWRNVFSGAVV
jgi:hypothetical protein